MTPEPFAESVKFDGKHWIGKKRPDEPLQISSYEHVAEQTAKMLGRNGIAAVPNARPNEYRFEEFAEMAKGTEKINDGRVFYDDKNKVYFLKAQEIKTRFLDDEVPITLLAYNLPYGKNLNDTRLLQVLEDADKLKCILGAVLPSCIGEIEENYLNLNNLWGHLDFVVGYSGGAAIRGTNNSSMNFYKVNIQGKEFFPLTKEEHKVGIIAVSGGHRTPKNSLEVLINGGQTIGRSYTEIPEPSKENFMEDLRQSLRNSSDNNLHTKPIFAEILLRHIPSIAVGDRIAGFFK